MKPLLFVLLLLSQTAALAEECRKLYHCLEVGGKLLGVKYVYDKDLLPTSTALNQAIKLEKDNADQMLSEALSIFGYAKVPSKQNGLWYVIHAREIRSNSDLPAFEASKKIAPPLPSNNDPVRLTYKGMLGSDTEAIAASINPLLSRYGKAHALRAGTLVVTDYAAQVRKVLPVLQDQDYPLTKEEREELALERKRRHDLELARLQTTVKEEPKPIKN